MLAVGPVRLEFTRQFWVAGGGMYGNALIRWAPGLKITSSERSLSQKIFVSICATEELESRIVKLNLSLLRSSSWTWCLLPVPRATQRAWCATDVAGAISTSAPACSLELMVDFRSRLLLQLVCCLPHLLVCVVVSSPAVFGALRADEGKLMGGIGTCIAQFLRIACYCYSTSYSCRARI